MPTHDLVVRGGLCVTAAGTSRTDIGIRRGRVAQIGGEMAGAREIDAASYLVLPGGVDVHVHLTNPPGRASQQGPAWVDDLTTGSSAALAGGITTLGNMTFLGDGELPLAGLAREALLVREQAIADFILHPVFREPTPAALDQIPLLRERGHTTIKFFMSTPTFDRYAPVFLEATARAGEAGLMTMIHCEDYAIIDRATRTLVASGRGSLRHYADSRPIVSEVVATERAVALAAATGAPVYVVHLSSAGSLDACRRGQAAGLPVYVETRPLYLYLTRERFDEPDGAKYVGQPPLREAGDVAALWAGLAQGSVHTVCSDHAPWSLAAKLDPTLSVAELRPGVENLETQLPLLYSEGVRAGRISLERFVEVTSTNAAKLFGLYPQKGCLAVGSDADLVLFDPEQTRTIGAPQHSRCDYSAFAGREVTGWPVMTLRRGEVAFDRGRITAAPGTGRLLSGGHVRAL
ncbi:MAG TPA: amidohydrolase family protein [bacterium]|nr:amidohydrolase family protein [bacterium]